MFYVFKRSVYCIIDYEVFFRNYISKTDLDNSEYCNIPSFLLNVWQIQSSVFEVAINEQNAKLSL